MHVYPFKPNGKSFWNFTAVYMHIHVHVHTCTCTCSCTVLVSCTMRVHAHVLLCSGAMHAAELAWIYSKQQLPFSNMYIPEHNGSVFVHLHVQHPSDVRYNAFPCDMCATCMYGHARTQAHTHQTRLLD